MKRTINVSDHRYIAKDFKVCNELPELNKREENKYRGEWEEYTNIIDITSDMASESLDNGYYRYYKLVKQSGYIDADENDEIDVEYEYIAIWHDYDDEIEED